MDVTFEPQRGRPSFSIEVGYFDTVIEIKEKVQKYQGIPISQQTLVLNGQILHDERNVAECQIFHLSKIHLITDTDSDTDKQTSHVKLEDSSSPKRVHLNVKTPTSKMHVTIEMDLNDTVAKLKEKIQGVEPIPLSPLVLHCNGNELHDHQSLRECEISDNAEIQVNLRPSPTAASAVVATTVTPGLKNKLKLMVLPKCGTKKIPVEVNASDNVGELRKELQKLHQRLHFYLPLESYFFIYKQNVMDDDKSFRWHHVGQGDTIEIFNGSVTGGS